ncbi:MAG: ABC transporter ATP-binding protein [Eubacteriaceae bacterium]|nr:ABC transporter ATP-binding protein [Eubacteriaceae bacterium]
METIVEMSQITKRFAGITACDSIDLDLRKGEIHALLGENGAGKSTLMGVLFGMHQPDEGVIKINGAPVKISSPSDATRHGIGMVHQHFKLVHNFTVLENIVLGDESTKNGFLVMKEAREKVLAISQKYGLMIDPDSEVSSITVGMQQRTEILKMLYRDNDVLIFDEPTAVLTPQEITELMKIMRGLAHEGKAILFISHKLNEIKEVSNRCTIIRKGKKIGTVDTFNTTPQSLSEMMVGRKVSFDVIKAPPNPGQVVLEVEGLSVASRLTGKNLVEDASFVVKEGEIVCIAGIEGNGQSDLINAITGLGAIDSGSIKINGHEVSNLGIRSRSYEGMAHIPEDRQKHGLVMDFNLAYNLVLQRYYESGFQKAGFLNYKKIREYASALIEKFDIRCANGPATIAREMSGGNQQKAIIAREVDRKPKLLVAVQPTRGLDVGAIENIHEQLVEERDKGAAILLVSLELDEVMSISDRILVMFEGKIVAEADPQKITYQQLGLYMSSSGSAQGAG